MKKEILLIGAEIGNTTKEAAGIIVFDAKKLFENDDKEVRRQLMVLDEMDHTHEILDGKANRRKLREQKRKVVN